MNPTRLLVVLFVVYGTRRVDGTLPFLKTLVSKHLQKHFAPETGCDDGEVAHVVAEPIGDDGGSIGIGGSVGGGIGGSVDGGIEGGVSVDGGIVGGDGRGDSGPIWIEYDEYGDVVGVTANDWKTGADAEKPIVIEVDERGNVVNVNAGHGHGWPETGERMVHDGGNVVKKLKNGGGLFLTMLKDEIRDKMNAIKSKWPFGKGSEQPATADLAYEGRAPIVDSAAGPVPSIPTAVHYYYTYYTPYQHQQPYYYGYVPQQQLQQQLQQQQQQWSRYAGLGPYPSSLAAYPSGPVTYPSSPVTYPKSPIAYPGSPIAYPNGPVAYPNGPTAYPGNMAAQPIVVYSTVADAPSPSVLKPENRADTTAHDDWNARVANDVGNADYPSRGDVPFGGRWPEDDTTKERRHVAADGPPSTTAVPQTVTTSEQPQPPSLPVEDVAGPPQPSPPVVDEAQPARS